MEIQYGVKYLGREAFGYTSLAKIDLPESVIEAGSYCFSNCGSIREVNIKGKNTVLNTNSFRNISNIDKFNFVTGGNLKWSDDKHTVICNNVVANEKNKKDCIIVYIDSSIKNSKKYEIPNEVTWFDYGITGEDLKLSDKLRYVNPDNMNYISNIEVSSQNKNFKIINGILFYSDDEFKEDYNVNYYLWNKEITTIDIPSIIVDNGQTKKINRLMKCSLKDYNLSRINQITINSKSIDECIAWEPIAKNMIIGENVSNIEPLFVGWNMDKKFNIQTATNGKFYSENGILYEKKYNEYRVLREYNNDNINNGIITISKTINNLPVTSIGGEAFYNITKATEIILPSGLKNIDSYDNGIMMVGAFYNCSDLKEITIPAGVTSIGENCFRGCGNLDKINMSITKRQATKKGLTGEPWGATKGNRVINWK